jgi:hypothetical protein
VCRNGSVQNEDQGCSERCLFLQSEQEFGLKEKEQQKTRRDIRK